MVEIAHLKKYIADNPQHFKTTGSVIIRKAETLVSNGNAKTLISTQAEELLGKEHAGKLFLIMCKDLEYIRISFEAIAATLKANAVSAKK